MLTATFCGGLAGGIEDLEIKFLIELGQLALSGDGEQFAGHIEEPQPKQASTAAAVATSAGQPPSLDKRVLNGLSKRSNAINRL